MNEKLLSIKETSEYLKIHWQTVRKYIKEKKLIAIKVGRNVRITKSEVDRFINLTSSRGRKTEIERKYIISNRKVIENRLIELDAKVTFHAHIIDHYLIPNDIRNQQEQAVWFKGASGFGLRIRETDNDYSGTITTTMVAKKLTKAGDHGIHEEIELQIDSYDKAKEFFHLLGLKENVLVDKDRVLYSWKDLKISIDEVKNAGVGMEIEYRGNKSQSEALTIIMDFSKKLGLTDSELSTKGISYIPFSNAIY